MEVGVRGGGNNSVFCMVFDSESPDLLCPTAVQSLSENRPAPGPLTKTFLKRDTLECFPQVAPSLKRKTIYLKFNKPTHKKESVLKVQSQRAECQEGQVHWFNGPMDDQLQKEKTAALRPSPYSHPLGARVSTARVRSITLLHDGVPHGREWPDACG